MKDLQAELAAEKEKNTKAQEEIRGLKLLITNLKEKVSSFLAVIRFFPNKWKYMSDQTETVRKIEAVYEKGEFRYSQWTGDRYIYINDREVLEKKFLQDYVQECRNQGLEPKPEMETRLTELEKQIDLHASFSLY